MHYFGLLEGDSEFKIICPFHDDINPSMLISLHDGRFYCFGCDAKGDAFDFIKLLYPKRSDMYCLKKYYRILRSKKVKRLKIKNTGKLTSKQTNEVDQVIAEDYYFGLKQVNWLTTECPERKYMQQRGFKACTLNLCKCKLNYNQNYPLIFPMYDMQEFKGWVCRTTNRRTEVKRKYLYNKGFSRRDTLVGNYKAKTVVLVEGYMDWLKMRQHGLNKVAAILGWKITQQQINKLKKAGVKNIISALDNDVCGEKGTEYLKIFFNVIRFVFPDGTKDPGDLTRTQFKKAKRETKRRLHN